MRAHTRLPILATLTACAAACAPAQRQPASPPPVGPEPYLLLWAEDEDHVDRPFAVVVDVEPGSARFGQVVSTLPLGTPGAIAHHSELPGPRDGSIWLNSFDRGETFLVDVRDPSAPALVTTLQKPRGLAHPHSIVPLASGNVLVTYQLDDSGAAPGGLAEHDAAGRVLRQGSAIDPASTAFVRPYSALVLTDFDRVLTTGADMHGREASRMVQVWRLSDLELLTTLELPAGPLGTENAHSFEPRVLDDGSVYVVTLGCGLYRIDDVAADAPRARLVHTFADTRCFMPVAVDDWWVQALPRAHAIEVLDLSDDAPRVVSRVDLPVGWARHWLAADARGERIVVTGYRDMQRRVLLLRLDRATGTLTRDAGFDLSLDGPAWPHGETGPAIPHAAVFLPHAD